MSKNLELIQNVHSELSRLHTEAVSGRENPRLIAVIAQVMRLTNTGDPDKSPAPDCLHEKVENGKCLQCGGEIPSLQMVPEPSSTEHEHVPNIFGNCGACGQCLHQVVLIDGTCRGCGEKVSAQLPDGFRTESL